MPVAPVLRRRTAERRAHADPPPSRAARMTTPAHLRFVNGRVPEAVDRMEAILLASPVDIYSRAGSLVRR